MILLTILSLNTITASDFNNITTDTFNNADDNMVNDESYPPLTSYSSTFNSYDTDYIINSSTDTNKDDTLNPVSTSKTEQSSMLINTYDLNNDKNTRINNILIITNTQDNKINNTVINNNNTNTHFSNHINMTKDNKTVLTNNNTTYIIIENIRIDNIIPPLVDYHKHNNLNPIITNFISESVKIYNIILIRQNTTNHKQEQINTEKYSDIQKYKINIEQVHIEYEKNKSKPPSIH